MFNWFTLLGCILVILKLTDIIDWNWILVLLPFVIIPLAEGIFIITLFILFFIMIRK